MPTISVPTTSTITQQNLQGVLTNIHAGNFTGTLLWDGCQGTTAGTFTTCYGTTTDATWVLWNQQTTAVTDATWYQWQVQPGVLQQQVMTPEQIAEQNRAMQEVHDRMLRDQERYRQEYDERCRREQEARTRARELLVGTLSPAQLEEFNTKRYFTVIGSRSRHRYRITCDRMHGNIYEYEGEPPAEVAVASWCAAPEGVPLEDALLGQKLFLEHDEPSFLRLANRTQLRRAA